jgi:hypothetical protein
LLAVTVCAIVAKLIRREDIVGAILCGIAIRQVSVGVRTGGPSITPCARH